MKVKVYIRLVCQTYLLHYIHMRRRDRGERERRASSSVQAVAVAAAYGKVATGRQQAWLAGGKVAGVGVWCGEGQGESRAVEFD